MSAIDGWSPPMNRLPSRKNFRYTSSGCSRAFCASACACAFSASSASELPTSPGYCGKPERRVRGARQDRVQRPDQVEHRAVDHRPARRVARVELLQPVLVAEVGHDRAALPHGGARQSLLLQHRRQAGRVLVEVVGLAGLAPDVLLLEVEAGGAHEDAHRQVVHARLQHARACGWPWDPPIVGSVSTGSWATGRPTASAAIASRAPRSRRPGAPRRCCSRRAARAPCGPRAARRSG